MDRHHRPQAEYRVVIIGVALAGGVGACIRWLVTAWFADRCRRGTGTAVVNLVGAFALGVVVALVDNGRLHSDLGLVLGVGLLGGLTTFSTWMVETLEESVRKPRNAWLRTVPLALTGIALAWIGSGVM